MAEKSSSRPAILGGIFVALYGVYYVTAGREDRAQREQNVQAAVNTEMNRITNQVANDAVSQYHIAKRQGDKMQVCVQAGMVSAAYLQAKDEANYTAWKDTEKADCAAAGLAR